MRKLMRNKKSLLICILVCVLISLIPTLITLVKKNFIYTAISCKVLAFIVLLCSLIYTYFVFSKQIKQNVMFGITRKATYKKWLITIIIAGSYVILLNIINCLLICILKPGVFNDTVDFGIMSIVVTQGFFIYFFLNQIIADVLTSNYSQKKRKRKVIINCVVFLSLSMVFSFGIFLCYLLDIDDFAYIIVPDVPMGVLILFTGIVLFLFERKRYCREEY